MTVIGARPQFVKASILSNLLKDETRIHEILIHSGQHYSHNMSESFFRELCIPEPKHNINVRSGTHAEQTGSIMLGLEPLIDSEKPDLLLVYGDTNTTLAGALVAAKSNVALAHVEAGLRSFRRGMPEEVNRVVTDSLSDYLFCPSELAVANLNAEGKREQSFLTGDIMYDIFKKTIKDVNVDQILREYSLTSGAYIFCTLHRAENVDNSEALEQILANLHFVNKTQKKVILALHPRTRQNIKKFNLSSGDLTVIDPLPYRHTLAMLTGASCVITDSGGLQKEAYFSQTPCITIRDETEWTETLEAGWNFLLPPTKVYELSNIVAEMSQGSEREHKPLYGQGNAGLKILNLIKNILDV